MATQWIGRCEFCNARMSHMARTYGSLCIRCATAMRRAMGDETYRPTVRTQCWLCRKRFKTDGHSRCKECRQ